MGEVELRVVASLLTAVLLCLSTLKMMGALQQSGYKNGVFFRWLKRKDNLYFNRLAVLSLCLALTSAVTVLCFSFLPKNGPLLVAWIPFFGLLFLFVRMDSKYALKVNVHFTGRLKRLFAVYFFFTACVAYIFIAGLGFLSELNGSHVYGLVAYIPFAVMPVLTPILLTGASAVTSVFEEKRNRKFIKRAGQVLDEREIIRIGVVGSYGKTTVKHILYTLLSEKYAVVATPESFNTPMGLAKTVLSPDFDKKQIFIAEMGARKHGDIAELCDLIHPDYAVFTGVCEQHIQGFGSIENVWAEKSEILKCGAKKVFCGGSLRKLAEGEFANKIGESIFVDESDFEVDTGAAATVFTMKVYGENIQFKTALLGRMAAENIAYRDKSTGLYAPHYCSDPARFISVIDEIGDPYLVALLDVAHAEVQGLDTSATEMIYALGADRLKGLHIHDNDKKNDQHKLPFTASIAFEPIVRALKEIGYGGYFTMEADAFVYGAPLDEGEATLKELARVARVLADMFEKA